MHQRLPVLLYGLAMLLWAPAAPAENSTKVPGYTIHHNALTTDVLSASVASSYAIRRSKNRALLNVSVIKDAPGTTGQPVAARVQAVARNLMGQSRDIPMREVREGTAIYYIGDFLVAHRDNLTFDLSVQPVDSDQTYTARLTQEFFTD
ncbi:MAG: hypothetical protein RLZ44_1752 [Pseudomonadota bacterium]|jgi:hypothetical protein